MTYNSGLTFAMQEELRRRGMTGAEIGRMYGVTKQAVSLHRQQGKSQRSHRELAQESFPWKVPQEYNGSPFDRKLRDHAEYVATGGRGMSLEKMRRLVNFYRKLNNEGLVVEFHPDIPPTPNNKRGGYAYRERRPEDGDLIIRLNDLAVVNDDTEMVWHLPDKLPYNEDW